MKKYILSFVILCSLPFTLAFAANPQLSVSGSGDGNNVLVTITSADGNSPVALYFTSSTDGMTRSQVIGTTNGLGAFSGTVSTTGVGINSSTQVYTIINGYTSNSLSWPYQNTNNSSQITFSQTNPYVAVGQSGSLTINGGAGNYYVSSNSNSSLVSVSLSGSTLSYTGTGNGSSIVTICGGNGGLCSSVTISTNTSTNGGLSIAPSSLVLAPGQSGTFTISGGNSPYTVTTVSGDNLTYFANGNSVSISGSTNGTRLLNVCSSNSICSQINVNITGVATNAVTFSPSTLTLNPNQSGTVQISGGNGSYTVSTISGDSLSSFISGNTLTISGQTSGTRALSICSSNGSCSTLLVSIGGNGQTSAIQYSLFLAVNDTMRINISGGNNSPFYIQSGVSSFHTGVFLSNLTSKSHNSLLQFN